MRGVSVGFVTVQVSAAGDTDYLPGQASQLISIFFAPGGVGIGGTDMLLWLRADNAVTSDGSGQVSSWDDQSQSITNPLNQAKPVGGASSDIVVGTSDSNYNPVISFSGASSKELTGASDFSFSVSNTIIVVSKNLLTTGDIGGIFDTGTGEMGIYAQNTGEYSLDRGSILTSVTRSPSIIFGQYNTGFTGGNKLFSNGLEFSATSNIDQSYNVPFSGTFFEIGGRTHGFPGRIFKGDIAEVIYYNRGISVQEQQQIQSYLSIKYGIYLDPAGQTNYIASDGTVIWNGVSNGAYSNTIIGLGADAASGLNQKQSSTGQAFSFGLGSIATSNVLNQGSFAADKSFLLVGNDGISST
jgi:hypothetical protein